MAQSAPARKEHKLRYALGYTFWLYVVNRKIDHSLWFGICPLNLSKGSHGSQKPRLPLPDTVSFQTFPSFFNVPAIHLSGKHAFDVFPDLRNLAVREEIFPELLAADSGL